MSLSNDQSTPITSRDAFSEWVNSWKDTAPDTTSDHALAESFEEMLTIDGFLETFRSTSLTFQLSTLKMVKDGEKCPHFAYYYLSHLDEIEELEFSESTLEILEKNEEFFQYIASSSGEGYTILQPHYESRVLDSLRKTYGVEHVNELMDYYIKAKTVRKFCNFLDLFENWNEIKRSGTPFSWSTHLHSTHLCRSAL